MKKVIKFLCISILIISILVIATVVFVNLFQIIKIMFFEMKVGDSKYPTTIWEYERTLHGISGIKTYYSNFGGEVFLIYGLPAIIVSIIYQLIYFKILRKKL